MLAVVLAWSVSLENNLKYKCKLAVGILQVKTTFRNVTFHD
jgi:hypothetical protein